MIGRQRAVMKYKAPLWKCVTSGMPQGSVWGSFMSLTHVNDVQNGLSKYRNVFANSAKLMKQVMNIDHYKEL